jgi:molybdopterin-guanine dinucleotide biosynthesis protein A
MSTPSPASGFILAGGQSVRLGRDKATLEWHGRHLLDHMVELLSGVCNSVQIVGRGNLPDLTPGLGPIGGILTALASSTTDLNLIVAVDLPLLTSSFLKYLKARSESSSRDLVVCKIASGFPLCWGARRNLRPGIDAYIASGQRSLHGLIGTTNCDVISTSQLQEAGFSEGIFANINTELDYRMTLESGKP